MAYRISILLFILVMAPAAMARQTAYWSAAPGPYGGSTVEDLAVRADGVVFAATAVGIFRSDDAGQTWESANQGILTRDIRSLLVRSDGSVWAATFGAGLYKLPSGSDTWQSVGLATTLATVIEETADGKLIVGTNAGLRISPDDGATWQPRTLEGSLLPIQALASNDTHLFAGTPAGVYRSADGGETWTFAAYGFQEFDVLSLATNAEGHVFAGVNPGAGGCVLYRSRGNGNIWTCIQPATDPVMVPALRVDADDRLIAGGYKNLFTSQDEGDHWTSLPAGPSSIESIAVLDDAILLGTNGMGILRSADQGVTWSDASEGILSGIRSLLAGPDGSVYVGTDGGVFVSSTRGDDWERLGGTQPLIQPVNSMVRDEDGRLVAGTQAGVRRFSPEVGWEDLGPPGYPAIRELVAGPAATLYAGYHSGVYVYDRGTWTPSIIIGPEQSSRDVAALTLTSEGTLLAGAAWDSWRRETGGTSWSLMSAGEVPWFEVESFALHEDRILAGTRFLGVIESTDDGVTWQPVGTGLNGSEDVRAIDFDHTGRAHIGTYGSGIFQLNPWTSQWLPMNGGLDGNHRVLSLAFDAGGNAYAGTLGGGLYRHLQGGSTAGEPAGTLPEDILLQGVFPNPARDQVTIDVRLNSPSDLEIRVFDLLGRHVRTIQSVHPAVEHRIGVDLRGLPAGMYLFRADVQSGALRGAGASGHIVLVR